MANKDVYKNVSQSDLRRRAASRRALPQISSITIKLLLLAIDQSINQSLFTKLYKVQ